MKILIIEDTEKNILSAQKFAQECGHEVVIATSYDEAEERLNGGRWPKTTAAETFQVVMTDMFLPSSLEGIEARKFDGTTQPYGLSLLLLALKKGVKAVGLFTDGTHHSHPICWALDTLGGYDNEPFAIGDATILCSSKGDFFGHWNGEGNLGYVPEGDPLEGAKNWMKFYLMLIDYHGRPLIAETP